MNNLTILSLILAVTVLIMFLVMFLKPNYEPKENENENENESATNKELKSLIQKMSNKLDDMELQDKQSKEKISALQLMSGIEREQTKYLTANVNKTLYT